MRPTLSEGEIVLARGSKFNCGHVRVSPGDIIVYHKNKYDYPHRVVAGPGDRVRMVDGRLFLNGKAVPTVEVAVTAEGRLLRETLPNGRTYEILDQRPDGALDETLPVTLGPEQWFALGDNRDGAADSRLDGPVARKDICAVAIRRLTSRDPMRKAGRL
jgi:signal peptidase I